LEQKINTQLQKRGLEKLLRLRYHIQYRKWKKNVVADTLSRSIRATSELKVMTEHVNMNLESLGSILVVVLAWYEEIKDSYDNDHQLHEIMVDKILNIDNWTNYTFINGTLRFTHKIMIGKKGNLREILV
jgi:hypothetical protein